MATIAFLFVGASSQRVWTIEQDSILTRLTYIAAAAQNVILSYDPSATAAIYRAPSADAVDRNIIATAAGQTESSLTVPVSAGERLLVAVSGIGTAVIEFESVGNSSDAQ
jgi:hypothetical protein